MVINGFWVDEKVIELCEKLDAGGAKAGQVADAYNMFYSEHRTIQNRQDWIDFIDAIIDYKDEG